MEIKQGISEPLQEAMEDILEYFSKRNIFTRDELILKFNDCIYERVTPKRNTMIKLNLEENLKYSYEINGKYMKEAGVHVSIPYNYNNEEKVKSLILYKDDEMNNGTDELKKTLEKITLIHELLHLISTKKVEQESMVRLGVQTYLLSNMLNTYKRKSYYINEVMTDIITYDIYSEIYGRDIYDISDCTEDEMYMRKTAYYIGTKVYRLIDSITGTKILEDYFNKSIPDFNVKLKEVTSTDILLLDLAFKTMQNSFYLYMTCNKSRKKEYLDILIYDVENILKRIYTKIPKEDLEEFLKEDIFDEIREKYLT